MRQGALQNDVGIFLRVVCQNFCRRGLRQVSAVSIRCNARARRASEGRMPSWCPRFRERSVMQRGRPCAIRRGAGQECLGVLQGRDLFST